jgi:outer membrane biogenesis lipoprotein LolB
MWNVALLVVATFVLAACEEAKKEQLKEQLKQAQAEADAIAQVDDARCQRFGKPGSNAYVQCRASLKKERAEMGSSGDSKAKGE